MNSLIRGLKFEWNKFRTLQSLILTALAVAATMPVIALFVASTESLQPDDTILGASLTASPIALLTSATLGALFIGGEYNAGIARTTFLAIPRRSTTITAKAIVLFAVTFVCGLLGTGISLLIGMNMIDTSKYASGEAWPAVIGVATAIAVASLFGLAFGAIWRNATGAIIAATAVVLLPQLFGPLFGDYQRWITGASPGAIIQKLTQSSDASHTAAGSLGGWPSLAVLLTVALLMLIYSTRRLNQQDA